MQLTDEMYENNDVESDSESDNDFEENNLGKFTTIREYWPKFQNYLIGNVIDIDDIPRVSFMKLRRKKRETPYDLEMIEKINIQISS